MKMTRAVLRTMRPGGRSRRRATMLAVPRGAATLLVVMVLFFIVALVAAYTSRNLIFEQRTSANQYRATQAFESAEAGLEWALTMLNSGRIDAACQPHVDPSTADESFRQRYLAIATDTGRVTARLRAGGQQRRAACVFDGAGWQCNCPSDADPALADPIGPGPFPAFVLRFYDVTTDTPPVPYPPGIVRVESTGCTRLDAADICAGATTTGDGRATVTSLAALKSALTTPPTAALTVRGDLHLGVNLLDAVNRDVGSGGLTLHVGHVQSGTALLLGPPGSPAALTVFEDSLMAGPGMDAERMFASVFGIGRDTYRLQPAAVFVDCAVDCTAATVRDLARLNPGRVLWIKGDFDFGIAESIGIPPSPGIQASPVMMVVTGNISISNAGGSLYGVVYTAGTSWEHDGGGSLNLRGAVVGESDLTLSGAGTSTIEYDPGALNLLRRTHGSFVRVPGSWRDF